jgi:hypothetical protein
MTILAITERPLTIQDEDDSGWLYADRALVDPPADRPFDEMGQMRDGWNGPGSLAPTPTTIRVARLLAARTPREGCVVAPTDDAEIVFEWEVSSDQSVFAHVCGESIDVVILGPDRDEELEKLSLASAVKAIQRALGRQ